MILALPPVRLASSNVKSASLPALSTLSIWQPASRPVLTASIFAAFASLSCQENHHSVPHYANFAQRRARPVQTLVKNTALITSAVAPAPNPAAPAPRPVTVAAKPIRCLAFGIKPKGEGLEV